MNDADRIAALEHRVVQLLEAVAHLQLCISQLGAMVFSDRMPGECPLRDDPPDEPEVERVHYCIQAVH